MLIQAFAQISTTRRDILSCLGVLGFAAKRCYVDDIMNDSNRVSGAVSPDVSSSTLVPARLGGRKVVVGVFAVMFSMTALAVVIPSLVLRADAKELDIYGEMPAFTLKDHLGQTMTNEHLRGRVLIADFIFTRCPTVCPVMSMRMHDIQKRTTDVRNDIKLISFSVDPEYDTVEVLAEYAKKHLVDASRWRFLTGDTDMIRSMVSDGFKLALDQMGTLPGGAPNIVHAEHFVLIDRSGRIRGYYDSGDVQRIQRLVRDARRLVIRTK